MQEDQEEEEGKDKCLVSIKVSTTLPVVTNRLMHLHLSLFPWILYKTLSSEIRMVMEAFNEGINAIRELGTALTAALAIKVTASQCTSKLW